MSETEKAAATVQESVDPRGGEPKAPESAPPVGVFRRVEVHVGSRVSGLQHALLDRGHRDHSATIATLARLRRSQPGDASDPASWSVIFGGTPPELVGRGEDPSRAELAVHAALVLFSGHAQSADGPRHIRGRRLGHAIGDLARADDPEGYADGAVARRFRSFATATTWPSAVRHLRGLISLMRSQRIGLDYGALAADLWRMQDPQGLRRARLQWARDFHHLPTRSSGETPLSTSTEQEN